MHYSIYINNKGYLDLPEDFSLTFQFQTQMFCIVKSNDIENARTDSFTLPMTERNMQTLQVFGELNFVNDSMQGNFPAILQINEKTYDGVLYVDSVTAKGYNCVFVWTSQNSALNNMGLDTKVTEWEFSESVTYGATAVSAKTFKLRESLFANIKYKSRYGNTIVPAINLRLLLHRCLTERGISSTWNTATLKNGDVWAVIPKVNLLQKSRATIQRVRSGSAYTPSGNNQLNTMTLKGETTDLSAYFTSVGNYIYYDEQYRDASGTFVTRRMRGVFTALKAKNALSITFPEDLPSNVFIGTIQGDGLSQSASVFYGDYEFAWDNSGLQISGTPLAGRKVDIPKGAVFALMYPNDYAYAPDPFVAETEAKRGWNLTSNNEAYTIDIEAADSDALAGDIVRLQDNLPDVSIKDIWLTLCICNGGIGMVYDDTLRSDSQLLGSKDVGFSILEISKIERKTFNFAQHNYLKTKHEKYTDIKDYVDCDIVNGNVNLEREKVVYESPFADGSATRDEKGLPCLELRNKVDEDNEYYNLGRVGASDYLQRVIIDIDGNALNSINEQNLCYKLKVKELTADIGTLYPYILTTNGLRYTLVESETNDNNHSITIQLI